jgi:hypothetical protein
MKYLILVLLLLNCCSDQETDNNVLKASVTTPPVSLGLPSFYSKYTDANGIPVISSRKVPDEALLKARETVIMLMSGLPSNVADTMLSRGVRVAVLARYEGTTDIPEYAFLGNDTTVNWDVRARGLGGVPDLPLTSCAEENLLCYQIDKYHAEDILIHEFAHTIHLVGFVLNDPEFNSKLQGMLDDARSKGKWADTYAVTNLEEYWAEGVQSWFNANADVPEPDGKHNHVNTRRELKKYDRPLHDFISSYFVPAAVDCSCHSAR